MLRCYKTEIDPTREQKRTINKTIGTCRYVYNLFLEQNNKLYEAGEKYMNANAFSKWMNNEVLPEHEELNWIKDVSTKSVRKAIDNADTAFQRFFNKISDQPNFKKKGVSDPTMYFVRNSRKQPIKCERHRIKIPTLGWVRIKEKGYIPLEGIISGSISLEAGRYYVSVMIEEPDCVSDSSYGPGIGVDLGIKDLAIVSDGRKFENINKSKKMRKLEKKLKREQRKKSRMHLDYKERKKEDNGASHKNLDKQRLKIQKLHKQMNNIRVDYENKVIMELVRTKPEYITIEDLNVRGMMKNRHLAKAVSEERFNSFATKLKVKCHQLGIEVRVVSRLYPSSKMCPCCGNIKKDLKLSDRIYRCGCGYVADRDINAGINLRDAVEFSIA